MSKIKKIEPITSIPIKDDEYVKLVSHISDLWDDARNKAFQAVNTSLLMANWHTGEYIVEFEQKGETRAKYGEALLVNLSKDLTRLKGRGFSRSNLSYMRKFYLAFPKCETVSHKLSWSHYFELLKCDDALEMQFYLNQSIQENWSVRRTRYKTALRPSDSGHPTRANHQHNSNQRRKATYNIEY